MDGINRLGGFVLYSENLLGDFLGRFGGLVGEIFNLACDYGKSSPASPA